MFHAISIPIPFHHTDPVSVPSFTPYRWLPRCAAVGPASCATAANLPAAQPVPIRFHRPETFVPPVPTLGVRFCVSFRSAAGPAPAS